MSTTANPRPVLGFIGQGFIGKNYADDFESRGYRVIRYTSRGTYKKNRAAIASCDIVFIAVPTPTTPDGFDASIVDNVLPLVDKKKVAVIKSTLLPGTTDMLQKKHPGIMILHSPEFLREATAAHDAAHPERNVIGLPMNDAAHRKAAQRVLSILPKAPYELIATAREAELIKYAGNCFLYSKIVFMNILYDMAHTLNANFSIVAEAMAADRRIGTSHMSPVHKSGPQAQRAGRGAGGHCFVKDMAAFIEMYRKNVPHDKAGVAFLRALETKNLRLLRDSGKDSDILKGVYGKL